MDIPSTILVGPAVWIGNLLWMTLLLAAMTTAPWRRLQSHEQLHVFLAGCVVLLVLWSLRAGIREGLNLHLLGVTCVTLMFGWRLAALAVTLVIVASSLNGAIDWRSFGVNALVMGGVPIAVTGALLLLAKRGLPRHFFVYVFVNAFLAGGLAAFATGLASSLLLVGLGPYAADYLLEHYLNYYALMTFPEAVLNGMAMTLLVAYRPHWVASFADEQYLHGK